MRKENIIEILKNKSINETDGSEWVDLDIIINILNESESEVKTNGSEICKNNESLARFIQKFRSCCDYCLAKTHPSGCMGKGCFEWILDYLKQPIESDVEK